MPAAAPPAAIFRASTGGVAADTLNFLTDFADQAVMLPLAVMIAIALAASGWLRGFVAWILCIAGMMGTMALLKYLCFVCALPLAWTGVHSPSGHTAASAAIYGGIAALLLRGRIGGWLLLTIPVAVAVLFGISRLAVHAHDVPEVLVGGAVGLASAALLVALSGPRPALRVRPIAVVALIVAIAFHGLRLQAESTIHHSALFTWIPLPATCRAQPRGPSATARGRSAQPLPLAPA